MRNNGSRLENETLPEGWVEVKIRDLGEVVSGGTPSTKNPDYWSDEIAWISPVDLSGYNQKHISRGKKSISRAGLENSSAKLMPAGSILFSSRAPIGYVAIASGDISTNQGFKSLVPSQHIFGEYIYYYLKASKQLAEEYASGTTFKELSGKAFANLPVPLPPIAEQQRIVDKIEELFSDLDSGINSLKTAQQQLKVYRQAVLKWAFEGKLTAQWREEQQRQGKLASADNLLAQIKAEREQRYQKELEAWQSEVEAWEAIGKEGKKPRKPRNFKIESLDEAKIAQLETLPEGWIWTRVDNLGDVQLGRQRAPKHHQGTHMRPYLRVANVFEDYIDTSDVLSMNFTPEEFRTYELHYGDILLNEGQSLELVGRSAIYKNEVPGACFQNTLVRFRPSKLMSSEFPQYVFLYYLNSGKFQKIAKWTTSIAHLGATRFAEMEFPLPPLEEQQQIVDELERVRSIIQDLENTIEANLKKAEALRQSILK